MVPCCVLLLLVSGSIHLIALKKMFEEFQDGCHGDHLGYHEKEKNFFNSDSPCCPDAPHQVSVQSVDVEIRKFNNGQLDSRPCIAQADHLLQVKPQANLLIQVS